MAMIIKHMFDVSGYVFAGGLRSVAGFCRRSNVWSDTLDQMFQIERTVEYAFEHTGD